MLGEIYNSCYETANSLRDWQKLNKNDIANLYLDNRYTEMGNIYGAALLCKYWYKVGLIWKNNKKAMTQEDCYEIVWDGIEKAMDYAAWRNPENSLYQDPNGPDKAINVCIDSVRKVYYTFTNRDIYYKHIDVIYIPIISRTCFWKIFSWCFSCAYNRRNW